MNRKTFYHITLLSSKIKMIFPTKNKKLQLHAEKCIYTITSNLRKYSISGKNHYKATYLIFYQNQDMRWMRLMKMLENTNLHKYLSIPFFSMKTCHHKSFMCFHNFSKFPKYTVQHIF